MIKTKSRVQKYFGIIVDFSCEIKMMKKLTRSKLPVYSLILLAIFVNSCSKTDDTAQPAADAREALTGSWTNAESSKLFGASSYTLTISLSNSDNENVIVNNFYNLGPKTSTVVKVSGNNLTIAQQQVSAQNVSGSGVLKDGKINWTYYTNDGGAHKDTCTSVSSK